jgi:hypothetical protein
LNTPFKRAASLGINKAEIQKTVDIAVKVRGGARRVMKDAIQKTIMNYGDGG